MRCAPTTLINTSAKQLELSHFFIATVKMGICTLAAEIIEKFCSLDCHYLTIIKARLGKIVKITPCLAGGVGDVNLLY